MNPAVKLIIGLIIFVAGLYWYVQPGIMQIIGVTNTLSALATVFAGVFGLILIFIGLIIAWIEYEDLKWEKKEQAEKAKAGEK
jgi:preprotein translocase subunit SecG